MGPGQKFFDLGQVGSIFCGLGQVELGQPFIVWVWKISPKNVKFFNFSLRVKKISSGQRQVSLLFTAGWVRSGPIVTFLICFFTILAFKDGAWDQTTDSSIP